MTSRGQDLQAENERLRARLVARDAQARRAAEERDDAEETTRVYRRHLYRVICEKDRLEVEVERLRMELAAYKAATPEEPHG